MENTKKYNRKQILDITVMALILAIRLVMEMLPAIKFGVYVQLGFGFIGAAIAGIMLGPWRAALVGILVLYRLYTDSTCRRTHLRILLI